MKILNADGKNCAKSIPLVVILLSSLLPIVGGCAREAAPSPEVVRPVKTMVVTAGDEVQTRTFSGRAQAAQEAELAFQTPGLLIRLPVREGQRIAKGDLIAQLRQEEFETRVHTLEAQLEQGRVALRALQAGVRPEERLRLEAGVRAADARLANAQAQHDRFNGLLKDQAVSRAEFEAMETSYRVAQEDVKSARQKLEQSASGRKEDIEAQEAAIRGLEGGVREAKIQLEDSTLRAPFPGVVAERFVEENQNVTPQQTIVRLQNANEVDIAVDIPESMMGGARVTADRIVKVIAEFTAAPGTRFPVTVKEIAQVADPVTQTFRIRGGMKTQPGAVVLPGMSATVTLTYRRGDGIDNRMLVPISAISKESSGEQVASVIEDQTVKRRPVKVGEATGGRLEVVDGLKPGDRIAVAGVSFLREGMRVYDLGSALEDGRP